MTITERWTIVADFVTRLTERSIRAICLLLLGALMGAWIVHLTESPEVQEQHGFANELGRRLNLCLVARVEDHAKANAAGVKLFNMKLSDIPTAAPPCKDGSLSCEPWERDWSHTKLQPGAIVTTEGAIIAPTRP